MPPRYSVGHVAGARTSRRIFPRLCRDLSMYSSRGWLPSTPLTIAQRCSRTCAAETTNVHILTQSPHGEHFDKVPYRRAATETLVLFDGIGTGSLITNS